ncbi:MAG: DUF389 domain-containing protein [Myxococcota bacterium]|nr:DUF389 domain-containing protein [Myxococcota bacterium]
MSVVAVIMKDTEVAPFIRWGSRLAIAMGEPLIVQVVTAQLHQDDPTPVELDATHPAELVDKARQLLKEIDCQAILFGAGFPLTVEETLHPEGRREQEWQAKLVICSKPLQRRGGTDGPTSLARQLLQDAPCDVLLLRAGAQSGKRCKNILVPASGGPLARRALQHAERLAEDNTGRVSTIYIQRHVGEDAEGAGQAIIDRELTRANLSESPYVHAGVQVAKNVTEGIASACTDETDLVLIGSSNHNFIRRALFGTVPESFFRGTNQRAVGVLRAAPELRELAHRRFVRLIDTYVPQLDRKARIELFEGLQNGSVAGMDFIMLICLSTAIAALGLLQNSAAVVIGAMLVAPLMTPMLGAGLGLLQGNVLLVRHATTSILIGFSLSLTIGLLFGLMTPGLVELTPELKARCAPNILDLWIALFSGVAAAYALARPGLLGALPGVAIAAALVPPIATTGIAVSLGELTYATLAATLFGTNLVAIILGSAGTFFVLGVRTEGTGTTMRWWAKRTLLGLAITTACLSIPLGISLVSNENTRSESLRSRIEYALESQPNVSLADLVIDQRNEHAPVRIELYSDTLVTPQTAENLTRIIRKQLGENKPVRIVTLLEWNTKKIHPK